jgi:hypothetical protein
VGAGTVYLSSMVKRMSDIQVRILDEHKNHSTFELLTGLYAGVQYQYLTLKIIDKVDHARIKFTYKVVKGSQRFSRDGLDNNPDFESIIEGVLHRMLMDAADEGNNDSRRNDS